MMEGISGCRQSDEPHRTIKTESVQGSDLEDSVQRPPIPKTVKMEGGRANEHGPGHSRTMDNANESTTTRPRYICNSPASFESGLSDTQLRSAYSVQAHGIKTYVKDGTLAIRIPINGHLSLVQSNYNKVENIHPILEPGSRLNWVREVNGQPVLVLKISRKHQPLTTFHLEFQNIEERNYASIYLTQWEGKEIQ